MISLSNYDFQFECHVRKIITLRCLKRDLGLSFGTFQEVCIGLYWAGNVGVKVPNERHGSLFKHQRVLDSGKASSCSSLITPWSVITRLLFLLVENFLADCWFKSCGAKTVAVAVNAPALSRVLPNEPSLM